MRRKGTYKKVMADVGAFSHDKIQGRALKLECAHIVVIGHAETPLSTYCASCTKDAEVEKKAQKPVTITAAQLQKLVDEAVEKRLENLTGPTHTMSEPARRDDPMRGHD